MKTPVKYSKFIVFMFIFTNNFPYEIKESIKHIFEPSFNIIKCVEEFKLNLKNYQKGLKTYLQQNLKEQPRVNNIVLYEDEPTDLITVFIHNSFTNLKNPVKPIIKTKRKYIRKKIIQ